MVVGSVLHLHKTRVLQAVLEEECLASQTLIKGAVRREVQLYQTGENCAVSTPTFCRVELIVDPIEQIAVAVVVQGWLRGQLLRRRRGRKRTPLEESPVHLNGLVDESFAAPTPPICRPGRRYRSASPLELSVVTALHLLVLGLVLHLDRWLILLPQLAPIVAPTTQHRLPTP